MLSGQKKVTRTLSLMLDGMKGTVFVPILVYPDGRGKSVEYRPHVSLQAFTSTTACAEGASTFSQRCNRSLQTHVHTPGLKEM